MCGIAGVAGEGAKAEVGLVDRMLQAIFHRGPDEGGSGVFHGAVLGNRRLSIIDLSSGRQPISNETGQIHVVFNGEIYDYQRHMDDLQKRGHCFSTRSDTEILVHRFEEKGVDLLDGLNGMWAIALYDERDRTLYLARDRFGKKPLYWTLRGGQLRFASELKALLVDRSLPRRIDLVALQHYLTFECVPSPESIFEGVRKLPPGSMLVFRDGEVNVRRYWDVEFLPRPGEGIPSFPEATEILQGHLQRAVSTRLVADVPVGVFLSGGIDSSTVAYHASRAHPGVKTFSIGFSEKSFDESNHARQVASLIGTHHQERILSARDSLDLLPKIVETLDEPFGDASIFPTYLLSAFAREQVTVALGGDGGDEVFLGYPTYLAHRLADYYRRIPSVFRRLVGLAVDRLPVSMENVSLDFKLRRFVGGVDRDPLVRNAVWLGSFTPEAKLRVLSPAARDVLGAGDGMDMLQRMVEGVPVKEPLERVLYMDMKTYMSDDILVKVDRASMACSLEVRAPFMDYELVDFVLRLPLSYRLAGLRSKALLKRAMAGRLPDEIIHRSKKGFGMPVAYWIRKELNELVRDSFQPDKLRREGFFDPHEVQRLLEAHMAQKEDNRKVLWTLLMFELWLEKYGETASSDCACAGTAFSRPLTRAEPSL